MDYCNWRADYQNDLWINLCSFKTRRLAPSIGKNFNFRENSFNEFRGATILRHWPFWLVHKYTEVLPVMDSVREKSLQDYRKKLLEHAEVESRLKESMHQYWDLNMLPIFYAFFLSFSAGAFERPHQAIWQIGERPKGSSKRWAGTLFVFNSTLKFLTWELQNILFLDCRWSSQAAHWRKM